MTCPSEEIENIYAEIKDDWEKKNPKIPPTYELMNQWHWQSVMEWLDRESEKADSFMKQMRAEHPEAFEDDDSEEEECNCDQALALKKRVAELEAQQNIPAHDLLTGFFAAVDKEISQPNGGTLADLYDAQFLLRRLMSEVGELSDHLDGIIGFDKEAQREELFYSKAVKVAACAALILIRRHNEGDDDTKDEPDD